MAKTDILTTRIEPELKEKAGKILSTLGMTPSEAINIFFNQIVLQSGLPFEVRVPQVSVADARAELQNLLDESEEAIRKGDVITFDDLKSVLSSKYGI